MEIFKKFTINDWLMLNDFNLKITMNNYRRLYMFWLNPGEYYFTRRTLNYQKIKIYGGKWRNFLISPRVLYSTAEDTFWTTRKLLQKENILIVIDDD